MFIISCVSFVTAADVTPHAFRLSQICSCCCSFKDCGSQIREYVAIQPMNMVVTTILLIGHSKKLAMNT